MLVRDFAVAEAINKKGLRRAKKDPQQLEQQDAYVASYPFGCSPKLALFAVFDGHGGRLCSTDATQVFPRHLRKRLRRLLKAQVRERRPTDLTEVLRDVYRTCDARLEGNGHIYEGCTATTVVVWSVGGKRYLQCANVGDSAAVLIKREGPPTVLTVDHKPSLESERARLRGEGVEVNESTTRVGGLAVSRALGDHFLKREGSGLSGVPYVSEVEELGPEHSHLLVASDGLWDVITPQAAADVIRVAEQQTASHLASKLLKQALSSFKCNDNVTVVMALLQPED